MPGGFREGVNYLGYASAEECVAQVDLLMRCPDAVQRMKEANAAYYREWAASRRVGGAGFAAGRDALNGRRDGAGRRSARLVGDACENPYL